MRRASWLSGLNAAKPCPSSSVLAARPKPSRARLWARGGSLQVAFPGSFLEENSLAAADLAGEVGRFDSAGLVLELAS